MNTLNRFVLVLALLIAPVAGHAQLIAGDLLEGESIGLLSYDNPSTDAFSSPGDGFQIYQRGFSGSIPFSVLDDSLVTFTSDTLGIIDDNNLNPFFGATDTVNGDNAGPVTATWVFDVSGGSDLALLVDIGAMGDFETSDTFTFSYSFDGGAASDAISIVVDEAGSVDYVLASGTMVSLDDPMTIDGVALTNVLQTFAAGLEGSGDELTITFTASTDGGSEALAFQNLRIEAGAVTLDAVAFDMVDSASQGLISFDNPFANAFASAADGFQKYQRNFSPTIPFSVLDDSLLTFPSDSLGIIDDLNIEEFFAATDTQNADNDGPVSATWTFDVTGATQLGLSIDMAAMGDFETNDTFTWSYAVDGGATQTAFSGVVNDAIDNTYVLAGGGAFTLNDPMTVDGAVLTNVLAPFTTAIEGEGSTLTVTLTLQTDGGSEAFAFQNLIVLRNFEDVVDPVVAAEIFEIQGDGDASPLLGQSVETSANVVTALAPNGFFMQTPASRSDGNADTSDGIFVFTDQAPSVQVGDLVDVAGSIVEFFGLTQFEGGAEIAVVGSGAALPAPIVLDEATPSPLAGAPSCAIEFECFESMLVSVPVGTVTAPNQSFGSDPIAEVFIVTKAARAFREPGVEAPGLGGTIPVWDGNPEIFELDPDKLGLENQIIPAGSTFSAEGVIGFEFGGYELWPTQLTVDAAPLPVAVRERDMGEFTIGSLNMFRLFDDVDDPSDLTSQGRERNDAVVSTDEYNVRLSKLADYVVNVLDAPDVLAVQEVEKLDVLDDLADVIETLRPGAVYSSVLIEGNDVGTIDVGFMVRETIAVDTVTQIGAEDILPLDGSLLNDRPPLLLEARYTADDADFSVAVIAVHNRSLGGIDSTGSSGDRVRAKRLAQAQSLAAAVQQLQTDKPDARLLVVGDFNAFEFSDGFVDVIGQISGDVDPTENLLSGDDLVDPNLINLTDSIAEEERYSFIFRGSAQTLDHALISQNVQESLRGIMYGRGNADAALELIEDATTPLRSSDHDGFVVYLTTDKDGDGVSDNRDLCPATQIPESVPTRRLGSSRYALVDGDLVFDVGGNRRNWFLRGDVTTTDTAGCSCEQIIDIFDAGAGQRKFGCSPVLIWVWTVLSDLIEVSRKP
ncbi:MAG: endonuclease/exonuclease/phosphatase family protein [Pseudomonadota bacterium]